MNKAPTVRFKGFTEEWGQHKLSEMTTYKNGRGHEDKQSAVGKYELINLNSVSIDGGLKPSGKFIDETNDTLHVDDLVMVLSDVGHGDLLGRVAIIPENNKFVLNQRVALLRPNDSVYPKFLLNCINAHQRYFKLNGAGSSQLNISKDVVEDFAPHIPEIAEQKLIANCFDNIDSLIIYHQLKYEKLVNIKKSMFYKMFPKNGSKIPEIRFAGFTGDWEQCKFNEVFDFMQNNALSRAELSNADGDIMNVHYGDILVKYGAVLNVKKDELTYLLDASLVKKYHTSLLQNGDIIIADAAEDETVGKCSEIAGLTNETVLSGLHTIPCRPKVKFAEGYLGYYLNSKAYHDQLLPLIQGTKISSVSKSSIQDTHVIFPKLDLEQKQIGNYFSSLDRLITLHQHKLEKLKQIKQAMLHKMFV